MILEPIQGEGGYIVPPKNFLKTLREICDEHGIMLIFDEIQCGMGRTGTLFAHEQFGVKPDIFTSAKALGGGIPLSAIIGKKTIMEQWKPGAHGGTFGGNPLACAAALETFNVIEDEHLLDNCKKMGAYFKEQLNALKDKYEVITDVRGLGLMIGMQLSDPNKVAAVRKKALEKGVLLLDCGKHNVIRFIAPLNVSQDEIDTCIKALDESLSEVA
jgi:4-aminobutyrate aminotransferase